MIRSRDLVIFVSILLFLVLGITVTYLKDAYAPLFLGTPVVFNQDANASTSFQATTNEKVNNRASTIERLKKALAMNTETIKIQPSVESEISDIRPETNTENTPSVDAKIKVLSCGSTDDSLSLMPRWPRSFVTIEVKDGMRLVVHTQESTTPVLFSTTTASSSAMTQKEVVVTSLLQMKMYPLVLGTPTCVPSTIIGVTSSGALLSNSDASFYKTTSSDVLIGYARD